MGLTATGWKNKSGTKDRTCGCGTWKDHWINNSSKKWPAKCSVSECDNDAELGAHVWNDKVTGERIVPMCSACNKKTGSFTLKGEVTLPSANPSKTCAK